jgi:TolB-like protein
VLYFDNLSRDSADAYLADGLTEEIIVRLGQIQRLEVKSRYEVQRFRGRPVGDPALLGRTLNTANFVSGSVQKAGGRVRVRVELVRASSRARLWGDVFDRSSDDVLAIEEEIARAVVQGIAGQLLPEERSALARRPTTSAAAYDLYLRGRVLGLNTNDAALRGEIGLFEQALALDSGFAEAEAMIARAWIGLADAWAPPRQAYPLARAAAERALRADSGIAEAWVNLAAVAMWFDWAPARAESLARRAIALDARSGWGHLVHGKALLHLGLAEEAAAESELAFGLDSLFDGTTSEAVFTFLFLGRYGTAATMARRFEQIAPRSPFAYWLEGLVYFLQGDCDHALPVFERAQALASDSNLVIAAFVLHCRGDDTAARQLIAARIQGWEQSRSYFRAGDVALAYAWAGDRDQAFLWLEKAFEAREGTLAYLAYPLWLPVRDDPRFVELVRRVGIESAVGH